MHKSGNVEIEPKIEPPIQDENFHGKAPLRSRAGSVPAPIMKRGLLKRENWSTCSYTLLQMNRQSNIALRWWNLKNVTDFLFAVLKKWKLLTGSIQLRRCWALNYRKILLVIWRASPACMKYLHIGRDDATKNLHVSVYTALNSHTPLRGALWNRNLSEKQLKVCAKKKKPKAMIALSHYLATWSHFAQTLRPAYKF